ncbi:MAG: hypothetical protein ACM3TU_01595 [Bacillota bacterium]
MALSHHVEQRVTTSAQSAIARITALSTERIRASRRESRRARAHREAEEGRRAREQAAAALELRKRIERAVGGVKHLLALADRPEIYKLLKVGASTVSSDQFGLPSNGFLYYSALDEQEWVAIVLYRRRVVVIYGGPDAQYEGHLEFAASDSKQAVREKLASIASNTKYLPFEVARLFDRPGDNGELPVIAFQVLVEANSQNSLLRYFKDAIGYISTPH